MRVGLLGWGAINQAVAEQVRHAAAAETPLEISAIASRFSDGSGHALAIPAAELAHHCDVIVEAAGPQSVHDHVASYLAHGTDVLLLSLGALADPQLRAQVTGAGPGRLTFCSGAIGGLDLVQAARLHGQIHQLRIETTKPSAVLDRAWMSNDMRTALGAGREQVECFKGSVAEAVTRFPESLNVSAALALAADCFDSVEVSVIGSPTATTNTHNIVLEADSGSYRFVITNAPSPTNPKTSHITAWAALRSLQNMSGASAVFV